MKLTFIGAAHEVTGSCTLLNVNGYNIVIDCGMEQGRDIYENCTLPVSPNSVDCVLLTHAHIDHSGKVPALVAQGMDAPVYATRATEKLCSIMLLDSAHIQESEAQWKNRKGKRAGDRDFMPAYTVKDAERALTLFRSCSYGESVQILPCVQAKFFDAGHLLGSASIELTVTENGITKKLLFSGDIGNIDRPLIRDPQKPDEADVVVIESTYGDRLHGERKDYRNFLASIIQKTLDRGGNVVIPSFAVGRTQEMLYLIREIKEQQLVMRHPGFQVWVDSPLSVEATKIYGGDMREYYDDTTLGYLKSGVNVLKFEGLHMAVTSEESKRLNDDRTPKVIISSSGMCEAGRIRHHLKHNLWRKESTVLFVGYQSVGTLGRMLIDGVRKVKIFNEEIQVNASIEVMDGVSGHGDMNLLLSWLGALKHKPDCVYVNHGDDIVCDNFAATVKEKLGYNTVAPYNGSEYDLITGACLEKGNMQRKKREAYGAERSSAFALLLEAGRRLMSLIEKKKKAPVEELEQFADEINNLNEKYTQRF